MLRLALAAVIASSSLAHADAPGQTPLVEPAPAPRGPKSGSTAMLTSIATTLGGFALMVSTDDHEGLQWLGAGMVLVGPSTGRWYAGEASFGGIAVRGLASVTMLYGVLIGVLSEDCDSAGNCSSDDDVSGALIMGGGVLFVGSAVYDVVMADRAARDYNRRNVTLAPARFRTADGQATGLVLGGHF